MQINPIEIKITEAFGYLVPWKHGKFATTDKKGCYAELSFEKGNHLKVQTLIDFPHHKDDYFCADPKYDLFYTAYGKAVFIADVSTKKAKSFTPFSTWKYDDTFPELLDREEGLILLQYRIYNWPIEKIIYNIVYNYKTDAIIYESKGDEYIYCAYVLDKDSLIVKNYKDDKNSNDYLLYYRSTGELVKNKFTEMITEHGIGEIYFGKKYMITSRYYFESENPGRKISWAKKISWNDDYSKITVVPLDPLLPTNKELFFRDFTISKNGEWASACISGYSGVRNDHNLAKSAFFHINDKYPGGISMAVLAYGYGAEECAFVNHPEYGECACRKYKKQDGLYLYIYKMSDVLAEINRIIFEQAKKLL